MIQNFFNTNRTSFQKKKTFRYTFIFTLHAQHAIRGYFNEKKNRLPAYGREPENNFSQE